MRLSAAIVSVGLLASGMLGLTTPAQADDYQPPQVLSVAPLVYASNGEAEVTATYLCFGGDGGGSHLYIGLKQGPSVNGRNHTGSGSARTFYSTNWTIFSEDGPLIANCDGVTHTQTFVLKPDPFWANAETAPPLRQEAAFVQFCLFDSTNTGEHDPNGFAFDYSMHGVRLQ